MKVDFITNPRILNYKSMVNVSDFSFNTFFSRLFSGIDLGLFGTCFSPQYNIGNVRAYKVYRFNQHSYVKVRTNLQTL